MDDVELARLEDIANKTGLFYQHTEQSHRHFMRKLIDEVRRLREAVDDWIDMHAREVVASTRTQKRVQELEAALKRASAENHLHSNHGGMWVDCNLPVCASARAALEED